MPDSFTYFSYPTPHGPLTIRANGRGVTDVAFGDCELTGKREASRLTNQAATELQEYFAGKRRVFTVRIDPAGSAFQKAVWNELAALPYGRTCTSSDIARAIGKPGAHRSVGTAVNRNPLSIIVPDHRVVDGAGGPLGTGKRARMRHALLAAEQRQSSLPMP